MSARGPVVAVVLAGGGARRFGADKLDAPLAGSTVLDTLLAALPPDWEVVVVGPTRPTARPVTWTREEPAGGGPLAGVLAGLAAAVTGAPLAAVVAGDMPFAAPALKRLVEVLRSAGPEVAAAVAVDGTGRPNPLLAAYRPPAVRTAAPVDATGLPARRLLDLPHVEVAVEPRTARDVDTRADLAALDDEA